MRAPRRGRSRLGITVKGQSITLQIGIVSITSGRALTQLTTQTQSATPIDLGATVQAAADKLKANAPT